VLVFYFWRYLTI